MGLRACGVRCGHSSWSPLVTPQPGGARRRSQGGVEEGERAMPSEGSGGLGAEEKCEGGDGAV